MPAAKKPAAKPAPKTSPAPKVAQPAPEEAPASPVPAQAAPSVVQRPVSFWSHHKALQVWSPAGFVGAFVDGEFTTDDPAKIATLRGLAECSERIAPKE